VDKAPNLELVDYSGSSHLTGANSPSTSLGEETSLTLLETTQIPPETGASKANKVSWISTPGAQIQHLPWKKYSTHQRKCQLIYTGRNWGNYK
jgi:hypothetical protein